MHSESQTSFHKIGPPLKLSDGAMIQRLCRLTPERALGVIGFASKSLCTDQFIRARLDDKEGRFAPAKEQAHPAIDS